jgi:hypothetical protein
MGLKSARARRDRRRGLEKLDDISEKIDIL